MSRASTPPALRTIGQGLAQLARVRWVRVVLVLGALVLIARLSAGWIAGKAVNRVVAALDLECTWGDLDLGLLAGRGTVRDLALIPRRGAESESAERAERKPILELEYAIFDLDVLALFRGDLRISRAEIDGLDLWAVRAEDGAWNLTEHFGPERLARLLAAQEPAAEEPPQAEAEAPREATESIDLGPPLGIDALRFQAARLHVLDRTVVPALDLEFGVGMGLSRLDDPVRPLRFFATLVGNELVDAAHLSGLANWDGEGVDLELDAFVSGLHPGDLADVLEPLDVHPIASTTELRMRAEGRVEVLRAGPESLELGDRLQGSLAFGPVRVSSDGVEQLALDHLELDLDSWSPRRASFPGLTIAGVRGRAALRDGPALDLLGLEFTGSRWADALATLSERLSPKTEIAAPTGPPSWLALLFEPDDEAYEWSLGEVDVRDVSFRFDDFTVEPPASIPLVLDRLAVGEVLHAPEHAGGTISVEAVGRVPGMADAVTLRGAIGPFAPRRMVDLSLQVDGVALDSIAPYMERVGLTSDLERGTFRARLVGAAETGTDGTRGELALDDFALEDGISLFGIRSIRASGLELDPRANRLRFGDIEVSGTTLALGRDPSHEFFAFGLRTLGFAPGAARESNASDAPGRPSTSGVPPVPGALLELPRVEVGRLAWVNSDVEVVDEYADPPRTFRFEELSLEVAELVLGGSLGDPVPEPATLTARVVAPELVEEIEVIGTLLSLPGPPDLTLALDVRLEGASTKLLTSYLSGFGLQPRFVDAAFTADLGAHLVMEPEGWRADAELTNLALRQDDVEYFGLDALRLEELRFGETLALRALRIEAPRVRVERSVDGGVTIAGVALVAAPVGTARSAAPAAPAAPPALAPLELPRLPALDLSGISLADARVTYRDDSLSPALEAELVVGVEASLGTDGSPRAFSVRLSSPGAFESIEARGTTTLGPDELAITCELEGLGLRGGELARLCPPGMTIATSGARLAASLEAALSPNAAGGLALSLASRDVAFGEEGAEPWLAVPRVRLELLRIDPAGRSLVVGPVLVEGARVSAASTAEGALRAFGLELSAPDEAETGGAPEDPASPDDAPAEPRRTAGLVFERLELAQAVNLELERFRFTDARLGPEALPVDLSASLQLEPATLFDLREDEGADEPRRHEPLSWRASGGIEGLVESWTVDGALDAFAEEPSFHATLEAQGVRPEGLVERVPALRESLEGAIEGGTLEGRATGTFAVRRARPTELGFDRPFSGEVELSGLAYRDAPGGAVLAGVDRVRADIERVDLERGLLHFDLIDVELPRGLVRRDAEGLLALGLRLKSGSEPTGDDGADRGAGGEAPSSAVAVEATSPALGSGSGPATEEAPAAGAKGRQERPEPAAAPSFEVRIDDLLVRGIDFTARDESVEPVVEVPLRELDLEVTRFTTRALTEKRTVRFSGIVGCGDGPRPVFGELSLNGRVSVFPEPAGRVQLFLQGVELTEFAPLAAEAGITVDDGALDAGLRLRLKGDDGLGLGTSLVFTDLDVDEPEGGILQQVLSLPVALDTALLLLRNSSGEHRFSFGVTLGESGVSASAVAAAATSSFVQVLTTALATAPLRVIGTVVPFGSGKQPPAKVWELPFTAGAADLDPALLDRLDEVVNSLVARSSAIVVVRHELSSTDIARAERLANPSREDCLELVRGLRQRKAELWRRRAAAAREARALFATSDDRAGSTVERTRELDRELAATEDALDRLLEVLRSDSVRSRNKRTKTTARELADLRLEAVEAALLRRLPLGSGERVELRSPRYEATPGEGGGRVIVELKAR